MSFLSIGCPFRFGVFHTKQKDKSLTKNEKQMKSTPTFIFNQNIAQSTSKVDAIKTKLVTKKYLLSPEACLKMLMLIEDGPMNPLHLRNFLNWFHPDTLSITPQMIFVFCLKCKNLQQKYGSLGNVPTNKAKCFWFFNKSQELSRHWDTKTIYCQLFKDVVQEILLGSAEELGGQIAVVKIMEKVKEYQENGYDYRVFYAEDGGQAEIMYMTLYQIRKFLLHGDLTALDWQLNMKHIQLVQATTKNWFTLLIPSQ